jgi:hypothetical protein
MAIRGPLAAENEHVEGGFEASDECDGGSSSRVYGGGMTFIAGTSGLREPLEGRAPQCRFSHLRERRISGLNVGLSDGSRLDLYLHDG